MNWILVFVEKYFLPANTVSFFFLFHFRLKSDFIEQIGYGFSDATKEAHIFFQIRKLHPKPNKFRKFMEKVPIIVEMIFKLQSLTSQFSPE